jgi:uncharacterized protein (TIGR03437 family)
MLAQPAMNRLRRLVFLTCLGTTALFAASDRIADRVDPARTAPLRGHRHSQAIPQNDQGPADPAAELRYVTLILRPASGLESFLAEQQTPSSPNYRRWLTPEQFGDRFGLSSNDIGKLTAWLQGAGLTVHDVARGRHWITFGGSVDQVGRALHTEFHRYQVKGAMHIANATDPSVPAAFAGVIAAFSGLDDFEPVEAHVPVPAYNSGGSHYLSPYDFATIYNVKALWDAGIDGTGISIAVIGRSDIKTSDIQAFRTRFGLPQNDPKVVLVTGSPDPGHTSSEVEADLDVEWAGAIAKNADIIYVNSTSVTTSLQYAVDQNLAPIMTYSFGSCEQFYSVGLRYIGQQANAQGITWMAASGDWGAATCDYQYSQTAQASFGPTASVPANLPEVTAVGGTQFNEGSSASQYWAAGNDSTGASALSYIPETVWNDTSRGGLVAAGGAPSSFLAKPWWQIGTPDDKVRDIPDISLTASTHDPYLIYTGGSLGAVGGTSASSPSFAGIVAMLNQYLLKQGTISQPGLGNINPTLYRLAQSTKDVFHDVVTGDNAVPCVQSSPMCKNGTMGYAAGSGYDLATGLGTVDANQLVLQWTTGTASRTSLSADASTVKPGTTVTLTATVSGGGKAVPTGTVAFVCADQTLGTATLAPAADGSSATASLSVTSALLIFDGLPTYATYSGDGVYGSSSGSTTVSADTSGGHSAVVVVISPFPVPQSYSGVWPFTVAIAEKAGVATKLTGFTVNGVDNSVNIAALNRGVIPANGFVAAGLQGTSNNIPSVPYDLTFVFTGQDGDGTTWTQQITVTFTGPPGTFITPRMTLVSTPAAVQQNPQADSACAWKQDFTLDEHSGYLIRLTRFTVDSNDFSGQIQSIFGTTRLAPYGSLHGTMCWPASSTASGSSKTFTITGTSTTGMTVTGTTTVAYQAAPGSTASLSASPVQVELTVPDSAHNAGATVDLTFSGASPSWQLAVLPANATTSWLKVSPLSGTGSGPLTLQADTSGLSIGAYQATIAISAPGAVPGYLNIPVVLVVGASSTKITGVANAASFQPVFAPGMRAAVYGTGLANTTATASTIPVPLKTGGVSATVNGISAPITGTYPDNGQINLQIPYEAGSGPALLAINNNGAVSYYQFQIAAAAPGLFGIWDPNGKPLTSVQQGQIVVAYITGDGDQTPSLATGATPASTTAVQNLPKARLPLSVSVGGVDAGTPKFYGMPSGFVGVTQINFQVPANAPLGKQDVVVTVGGVPSNAVSLTVTAAQ